MRAVLERHGGTVEKFIGDAVMAVFGLPRLHEDDALRAVRAAADMQRALDRAERELEADYGVQLANRIGVNTGEVVAGRRLHAAALVTGDAVNVAARLEQARRTGRGPDRRVDVPPGPRRRRGGAGRAARAQGQGGAGRRATGCRRRTHGQTGVARRLDAPMVGREPTSSPVLRERSMRPSRTAPASSSRSSARRASGSPGSSRSS